VSSKGIEGVMDMDTNFIGLLSGALGGLIFGREALIPQIP